LLISSMSVWDCARTVVILCLQIIVIEFFYFSNISLDLGYLHINGQVESIFYQQPAITS